MTAAETLLGSPSGARGVRAPTLGRWLPIPLGLGWIVLLVVASVSEAPTRPLWLTVSLVLLLWLAVLDLRHQRVPNAIVYPTFIFVLGGAALDGPGDALFALAGATLGFALVLALAIASRGAMGMGDVKVAVLCGSLLGPRSIIAALALGSGLAAAVALGLLVTRLASRHDSMPLVPFFALATLAFVS